MDNAGQGEPREAGEEVARHAPFDAAEIMGRIEQDVANLAALERIRSNATVPDLVEDLRWRISLLSGPLKDGKQRAGVQLLRDLVDLLSSGAEPRHAG